MFFGIFNLFWAFIVWKKADAWRDLVGESAGRVVDIFMYVDLLALAIVLVFSAIVIWLKGKGIYEGEVMSQGNSTKIRLR